MDIVDKVFESLNVRDRTDKLRKSIAKERKNEAKIRKKNRLILTGAVLFSGIVIGIATFSIIKLITNQTPESTQTTADSEIELKFPEVTNNETTNNETTSNETANNETASNESTDNAQTGENASANNTSNSGWVITKTGDIEKTTKSTKTTKKSTTNTKKNTTKTTQQTKQSQQSQQPKQPAQSAQTAQTSQEKDSTFEGDITWDCYYSADGCKNGDNDEVDNGEL